MSPKWIFTVHHPLDQDSGAAGSFLATAKAIAAHGVDTQMISFDGLPRHLPSQAAQVAFPYFVAAKLELLGARRNANAIIASTGDTWLWSRWLRHSSGPPLIVRSTGLEHLAHVARLQLAESSAPLSWRYPIYHGGLRLREVAASLRHADRVAFLNEDDRGFAVSSLGVEEQQTLVLGQAIADELLNRPPPSRAADSGPLHLAWIGSFSERKGIEEAMPEIGHHLLKNPEATVSLLGVGVSESEVLVRLPAAIHPRVSVVPRYHNRDLPMLLGPASVLLFPSHYEGFGKALAEGMACGLAPVAARNPGSSSITVDGNNAIVVPPRDRGALRAALRTLDENRDLLHNLRVSAHRSVQRFRWSAVAERLMEAVDDVNRDYCQFGRKVNS